MIEKRILSAVGLAACLLLLSTAGMAEEPEGAEVGPAVGSEAPDFTLPSVTDGETYTLSEDRGERPVVMVFFRGAW